MFDPPDTVIFYHQLLNSATGKISKCNIKYIIRRHCGKSLQKYSAPGIFTMNLSLNGVNFFFTSIHPGGSLSGE